MLAKKNENLWESLGGIIVNGALGRSLEYPNVLPRKNIEGPLWNFLKVKPWPHPRPDQKYKILGACGPLGFFVFGLALDVALGLPLENPWGSFNLLPREYIEYSREPPMGLHSPCYLLAFPTDCPRVQYRPNKISI